MLLDARLSGVDEHSAPGSFTVSLRYARGCMPISFTVRERGGIRGVLLDDRGAPLEGEVVAQPLPRSMPERRRTFPASGYGPEPTDDSSSRRFRVAGRPRRSTSTIAGIDSVRLPRDHPGTRVPGELTIVTVDGPTIVDAGIFRVPADPDERTITGVVVWSDGRPAADADPVAARRRPGENHPRRRRTLPRDAAVRRAL